MYYYRFHISIDEAQQVLCHKRAFSQVEFQDMLHYALHKAESMQVWNDANAMYDILRDEFGFESLPVHLEAVFLGLVTSDFSYATWDEDGELVHHHIYDHSNPPWRKRRNQVSV